MRCVFHTQHLVLCNKKAQYIYEGYSLCYNHLVDISGEVPTMSVDVRHRHIRQHIRQLGKGTQ